MSDRRVGHAAAVSGQHTEGAAADERDGDGQQTRQKIGLDAHDQTGKDVPPHEIGAEQMACRTRRRHHQVEPDVVGVVGQQMESPEQIGHDHERYDQQAVAHIHQIGGIGLLPEGNVRKIPDLT